MDRCLLTASVAGMIPASHSAEQVRPAVISHLPTEEDLLLITLDYRDDVGSFSIATKRAKTTSVDIEFYTIGNGIGARKKGGKVGSRSTAGGVMVLNVRRYTGFHRARYKKSSASLSWPHRTAPWAKRATRACFPPRNSASRQRREHPRRHNRR
jgi:hypothetical protein